MILFGKFSSIFVIISKVSAFALLVKAMSWALHILVEYASMQGSQHSLPRSFFRVVCS